MMTSHHHRPIGEKIMRHVTLTSVPRLHHEHFLTSISCQVGVFQTMCFSVVKAKLKSKTHEIHESTMYSVSVCGTAIFSRKNQIAYCTVDWVVNSQSDFDWVASLGVYLLDDNSNVKMPNSKWKTLGNHRKTSQSKTDVFRDRQW